MEYLDEKWQRHDVRKMFADYLNISFDEALTKTKTELLSCIPAIAKELCRRMQSDSLNLKPIHYFEKVDGMSGKVRKLGVEEPLHQMLDYVCVNAMKPMFSAKIGVFQCSSIKGRGQTYGKKHIERWRNDIKYFAKGDITKCFPSIPVDKLKNLLSRDVKNADILKLAFQLIDMFDGGLSIGSYLSQYLCNYYLSYAYHFAAEKLFKIRKSKRNGNKRVRLINHVLFYMDDFLLTGTSKKDVKKGMKMLVKYIRDFLGLAVKDVWQIQKFSAQEPIDMMGFVFRPDRTTIRAKIFIKTRRQFLRAWKELRKRGYITIKRARMIISAFGWYKHTDSFNVRQKLKVDEMVALAKSKISKFEKGGADVEILHKYSNAENLLLCPS